MDKIRLQILGMSYSQSQSGAYALILGETTGERRLPIIIGGFEAQAIAIELEKMKPARPLTHDLLKSVAISFNIEVTEVVINKFHEGVFYAQLVCNDGLKTIEIDSRTSDAVAMAIRFKCPIYTTEKIMSEAGIIVKDEKNEKSEDKDMSTKKPRSSAKPYAKNTIKDLEDLLQKAIENENYEQASEIRDEINRRD
ncbi:MAG: bifunctional nuclease family protein [Bacteroidales bacterium]|nr:bifunctional nuclease family protein [Bacteroidales bacterium]